MLPKQGAKPRSALKRRAATAWGVNIWYNLQQGLAEGPAAWLFARQQAARVARGDKALEPHSHLAAGALTQIKMRMFSVFGLCAVYVVWAVMAWLVFVYVRRLCRADVAASCWHVWWLSAPWLRRACWCIG